jgi:hypothetical protein
MVLKEYHFLFDPPLRASGNACRTILSSSEMERIRAALTQILSWGFKKDGEYEKEFPYTAPRWIHCQIAFNCYSLRGSAFKGILAQRITSIEGQPYSKTTFPSIRYIPAPLKGDLTRLCEKCTVSKNLPSTSRKVPNFIRSPRLVLTNFSQTKSPTILTVRPS